MEKTIIDTEFIYSIMNELAEIDNKIFSNEAQFKLDFIIRLLEKLPLCEIVTEYRYTNNGRKHIDFVVFLNVAEPVCFPFEIKYKTLDKEVEYRVGEYIYKTYNQGSYDTGCYDFIKDIRKLETLVDTLEYKGKVYKVQKGYAVFLTNGKAYYKGIEKDEYYWQNFSLAQKNLSGKIKWRDMGNGKNYSTIGDPIELKGSYSLKWKNYNVPIVGGDLPRFKYLVVDV